MKRTLRSLAAAFALLSLAAVAHAAPVNQLGFALDASGSVDAVDYDKLRVGLNAALAGLPQDGTVEITVVSFNNQIQTVVAPTILTAGTLDGIQTAISDHAKGDGSTNTAGAIASLTSLLTGSGNFADPGTQSFINIATDGDATNQPAAELASMNAALAGIDSLSLEAIGSGVNNTFSQDRALALAFPGPATLLDENETNIPDPLGGSWVVPVTDFDAYADVVAAKVNAIVVQPPSDVPEPSALALAGIGLVGMVLGRRRRSRRD